MSETEDLRARAAWALLPGKDRPRPIVVWRDRGPHLDVFKGTSTIRGGEVVIRPQTRVAAAWIASGRPLSNPTAFSTQVLEIPRSALALPIGGRLDPITLRELELPLAGPL